jgi:benzoate/toluate 1,2-dioxygenase beta subunit
VEAADGRRLKPDSVVDRAGIEDFLYREARLLDERRLDEWLALFTADATYWIPCGADDIDPTTQVSIAYDDRRRMEERVRRLQSGFAHAQDPPSRTRRLVGNVQIDRVDEQRVVVSSSFLLAELRRGVERIHAGRYEYHLEPTDRDGGWRIAFKKVELINNAETIDNLTFIV